MKTGLRYLFALAALFFPLNNSAMAEDMPTTCEQDCPAPFVANEFWTTEYGTAAADVSLSATNFLVCPSTSYALCFYSGPDTAPTGKAGKQLPKLPCKVSEKDPKVADCRCYVESGESYVLMNGIRNTEAYIETVRICGQNGEKCRNMASVAAEGIATKLGMTPTPLQTAPVCNYLVAGSDGKTPMEPGSEIISTYSFAEAKHYGIKQTDCTSSPAPYAGCMTASCTFEKNGKGDRTGFANCKCPTYTGPYQVGQANVSCDAGDGNVWSASYTPPKQ